MTPDTVQLDTEAQVSTAMLIAVVPFEAMTFRRTDGAWETGALNIPYSVGLGSSSEASQVAASQAVTWTLYQLIEAANQGIIPVTGDDQ